MVSNMLSDTEKVHLWLSKLTAVGAERKGPYFVEWRGLGKHGLLGVDVQIAADNGKVFIVNIMLRRYATRCSPHPHTSIGVSPVGASEEFIRMLDNIYFKRNETNLGMFLELME